MPSDPPRVAVIAVHGVGDHKPFQTAREIGDLLSNLKYEPSHEPRYAPFTETVQRINVRPVRVVPKAFDWFDPNAQKRTWGPMDALTQAVYARKLQVSCGDNEPASLDHLFMEGQLANYNGEGPEDTYQMLRLEGRRVPPVNAPGEPPSAPSADIAGEMAVGLEAGGVITPPQRERRERSLERGETDVPGPTAAPSIQETVVHIYEMYWSDLSGLGDASTKIFSELYQILFHLGSVGVNTVKAAAVDQIANSSSETITFSERVWRFFDFAESSAAAMLAWPIPILNLFIAALIPVIVLLSFMRTYLSGKQEFIALEAFAGLVLTLGSAYALSKVGKLAGFLFYAPLLLVVAACTAIGFAPEWRRDTTEIVGAFLFSALTYAIVWRIMQAYDRRRPGSRAASVWVAAILAAMVIFAVLTGRWTANATAYPAIAGCLNVVEIAFDLMTVAWIAFYLCYVLAYFAGLAAVRFSTHRKRDCLKRTRWTAQLTLALPACFYIVITLAGWAGVLHLATDVLPGQENVPASSPQQAGSAPCMQVLPPSRGSGPCKGKGCVPVQYKRIAQEPWESVDCEIMYASEWAQSRLQGLGAPLLAVILVMLGFGVLVTAWVLLPSVIDELSPPGSAPGARESAALGEWLDRGFRFLRLPGEVLYWNVGLMPFLVLAVSSLFGGQPGLLTFSKVLGTIVAGTAVGILGFGGRLKQLALGFRPVVRVLLDVDNWLREHPRKTNPTARISGRYVSILRRVLAWRDAAGKPYDALVVVAHSQGTVITADLLRFLTAEMKQPDFGKHDPELAPLQRDTSIYLFTMGSPLRQLYSLRFPFLYGWAGENTAAPKSEVPDIDPAQKPMPENLGVKMWVNAYRSGDYIGRFLWRPSGYGSEWEPAATRYDETWDPPAGKPKCVSADPQGTRIEFCIGAGAHTHYWDHTAELIGEVLDRLIVASGAASAKP